MSKESLEALLNGSGQEHILQAYDTLNSSEQTLLAEQIRSGIDFKLLNRALKEGVATLSQGNNDDSSIVPPPAKVLFCATSPAHAAQVPQLEAKGCELIANGKAAVLLLAGGSGTRLGVTIPKGLFTCDLLREQKSLFQFHCEKIVRVEQLAVAALYGASPSASAVAKAKVQLLVMTSSENDATTQKFFRDNNFFGLQPIQVSFFMQSSLPCYDEETGKILMASPHSMCLAPGGNGGVYQCLARASSNTTITTSTATRPSAERESMLDMLRRRGVCHVQILSVDNILARVGDPLFFGYSIDSNAAVAVKTTPKANSDERVGVFALKGGHWGVVEYTEIGSARAGERSADTGELRFNCGNIASHNCTVEFLALAAEKMKSDTHYHAARKKIMTQSGPVMGVKLEAFIFDMFRYCDGEDSEGGAFRIMQVDRAEEFAPIKNAEGTAATDTAGTAAHLLLALHTRWSIEMLQRRAAVGSNPQEEEALRLLITGARQVEVSPLVSLQGEGLDEHCDALVEKIVRGKDTIVLVERKSTERAKM